MKTSNEADEKFKKAFDALSSYGMKDHAQRWPERLPVMLTLPLEHFVPGVVEVEFLIHKSLIDNSPTSVKCEPAH